MKLYDFAMAPNSRRVRIFIAEKNIEVPVEQIDLLSGENLEEKYREKNQFCLVPTLELDDGRMLTESGAICEYLEELYPEPSVYPPGTKQQLVTRLFERPATKA